MANDIYERSLELHKELRGKLRIQSAISIDSIDKLALAYTPGVARACEVIKENPDQVYTLTRKWNTVAVLSDGTAVLGLGNIGPLAAMPVMEGKAILLKAFANIDSYPVCIQVSNQENPDPNEIIHFVKMIAPTFGGINLEDLKAPHCVIVEEGLQDIGIPVFHDDQHGTAIVVLAGILNGAKAVHKDIRDMKFVISGAGAAGSAIIKMLHNFGVNEIYAFDKYGIITKDDYESYDFLNKQLSQITNPSGDRITMEQAMVNADAFIGVSVADRVTQAMVRSMKKDSIVFAMANPKPEISEHDAILAGAKIVGTGRSGSKNQVNNVHAFPGVFRGALDCRATKITPNMKMSAAHAIASMVTPEEIRNGIILPNPLNEEVVPTVARAVMEAAIKDGVARI